ncbi:hypothetical protein NKH53_31040 [Mesorhizobium australicum]|uniref:hypothetical protein n=1 Tax=Mesorhizobium australicum TaxID=536018 RepID=UPI0033373C4B
MGAEKTPSSRINRRRICVKQRKIKHIITKTNAEELDCLSRVVAKDGPHGRLGSPMLLEKPEKGFT